MVHTYVPRPSIVIVLLLFLGAPGVYAQCPSELCFCAKSTAEFVCNAPLLKGQCEVGQCTSNQCSGNGFRCQPRISAAPNLVSPAVVQAIRNEIEKNGGCKSNVCFAIDGSSSIDANEFKNQTSFVADVLNIISTFGPRVAGTQYTGSSHPIRNLSTDLNGFLAAMKAQSQIGGSTSISSGIEYCNTQLLSRPLEPKSVVVLGDGFQTRDQRAVASSNTARSNNALVTVVAVANANRNLLLELAGGDKSLAFTASSFSDRVRLAVVLRELAVAICRP